MDTFHRGAGAPCIEINSDVQFIDDVTNERYQSLILQQANPQGGSANFILVDVCSVERLVDALELRDFEFDISSRFLSVCGRDIINIDESLIIE